MTPIRFFILALAVGALINRFALQIHSEIGEFYAYVEGVGASAFAAGISTIFAWKVPMARRNDASAYIPAVSAFFIVSALSIYGHYYGLAHP